MQKAEEFVADVGRLTVRQAGRAIGLTGGRFDAENLLSGKMLRTRLAARLFEGQAAQVGRTTLVSACAAAELFHAASLCHDDVIDDGLTRRGRSALWAATSRSGAVLIGDLLLCEALELLREAQGGRYLGLFMRQIREVLEAEVRQELVYRGRRLDAKTCVGLSRGKTGALFAFVGGVCGGEDETLARALLEAGYGLGTAYQLADDLLDVVGSERRSGKTLGTDRRRGKFTLAQVGESGRGMTQERVRKLCAGAVDCLHGHPPAREALKEYLLCDLMPVLDRQLEVRLELAI